MRCLLVSYAGLGVNSTDHVLAFGWGLAALGCSVRVAAAPKDEDATMGFDFFRCHPDGSISAVAPNEDLEAAEIVHLWTPRAPVFRFIERYRKLIAGAVVVHLEDDEDEVLRKHGWSRGESRTLSRAALQALDLAEWSHPGLADCLLRCADAITVLSPELLQLVPETSSRLHILPPLGAEWQNAVRNGSETAIRDERPTIVYSGGIHAGVVDDFLELCRAAGSLKRQGQRVRLVRTGPPMRDELREQAAALAGAFEDLGFLSVEELHRVFRRAHVLVQPGSPDAFNRRRLPAKLVPYLASGTPVVMPGCYDWLGVRDREHAAFTRDGSSAELVRAITSILHAPDAASAMAVRAAEFARERFSPLTCCKPLAEFYASLLQQPARVCWRTIRKPRTELPLLVAMDLLSPDESPLREVLEVVAEEIRHPAASGPPRRTSVQFFWPFRSWYAEQESITLPISSHRWQKLTFGPRMLSAGARFRLDPSVCPGTIEIAAISFRDASGRLLARERPPQAQRPEVVSISTAISLESTSRRVWRWQSTGNDPQLLVTVPAIGASEFVEVWMRWTPLD